MHILSADPHLSAAIARLVVGQMAGVLRLRCPDIGSEVAVIYTLAAAGFGLPSIQTLHCAAQTAARCLVTADMGRPH